MYRHAWLLLIAFLLGPPGYGASPVDPHCFLGLVPPQASDPGRWKAQLKGAYDVGDGRVAEVFKAPGTELNELHPKVVEALTMANRRFVESRGDLPADHIFQKQKELDASGTSYIVVSNPKEARGVTAMGVLIEPTGDYKLPVETEFKPHSLRRLPDGKEIRLIEIARLASDQKGSLPYTFRAMARYLLQNYGSPDQIPSDVHTILWTRERAIANLYIERYGFTEWRFADGPKDKTLMSMPVRDFVNRYAGGGSLH